MSATIEGRRATACGRRPVARRPHRFNGGGGLAGRYTPARARGAARGRTAARPARPPSIPRRGCGFARHLSRVIALADCTLQQIAALAPHQTGAAGTEGHCQRPDPGRGQGGSRAHAGRPSAVFGRIANTSARGRPVAPSEPRATPPLAAVDKIRAHPPHRVGARERPGRAAGRTGERGQAPLSHIIRRTFDVYLITYILCTPSHIGVYPITYRRVPHHI